MKPKKKDVKPESGQDAYTDEKFHRQVFEVLADLQLSDGVPMHKDAMSQELWYKLHLRKGQAHFFINRMVKFGWVIPDRGRGLFMNEFMMEELEGERRLEEQRAQASASMWDRISKDATEWITEHWSKIDQQGNAR